MLSSFFVGTRYTLIVSTLERRQLWSALSDLYLDTEVRWDLPRLALRMAESPFTRAELERLFKYEVTPVVHTNMLGIAGQWAGFADGWLHAQIEQHLPETRAMSESALEQRYKKQGHAHQDWLATLEFYDLLQRLPRDQWIMREQIWSAFTRLYFETEPSSEHTVQLFSTQEKALRLHKARAWEIFELECEPILKKCLLNSVKDPTSRRARANVLATLERL
jgi:hypothetical protein